MGAFAAAFSDGLRCAVRQCFRLPRAIIAALHTVTGESIVDAPLICLASGSPRRREILENLGYRTERLDAAIDETPRPGEPPAAYVLRMAREKNAAALRLLREAGAPPPATPVLSADTVVVLANEILGKPESAEHARAMLRRLAGREHEVLTAVCLFSDGLEYTAVQASRVSFADLSDAQIAAYVQSGEPLDKAGAYGIQGAGGVFVRELCGSFSGVMGLPVYETCGLLRQAGYAAPPFARKDEAV
ncbi:Maf-like protein yhdE [Kingella potus]|uniref:dTTP/UTP pyrophosphatase n=1 Tax=Kingella potus TaxID=265175 RepID=A0A377R260_9NEIS|nr:Maf family protein [Kingella potus]UOP01300.1 Maf family protein [Kingella potus]STR00391.1 Maf-like protein yhdE [Kingella potus]